MNHKNETQAMIKQNRNLLILLITASLLKIFYPFLIAFIPKVIVENMDEPVLLIQFLMGSGIVVILLQAAISFCDSMKDHAYAVFRFCFFRLIDRKALLVPYDILSSQQFQDDYKFSVQFVDDIENGLQATMEHISKLLTNVGLFVLFLTSMTFVDRWIPLYVIALTVMDFSFLVAAQSFEGKHLPELKRLDNQLKTVELRARQAGQAKDIRMFHAAAFFGEMYKRAGDEKSVLFAKIQRKYRTGSIVRSVLGFLRDAGCYAYLIYLLYASKIGLGDFVFMIGIVINFSDNLAGVFMNLAAFTKDMISLRELKRLLKSPESGEDGEVPVPDTFESIRFEGVSYRYGNDQEYVLKDISFCINAGEQIGLVGLNGAGKTTLTLLLCGLLKPTGGKIFYNGIDIEQFSRKEYISLFSNVFQDINLLHFTIGENITGSSDGETWKRAETVLKTAGFERNLGERGTAASIGKTFDERGIDFSGGEKQKLAIARALYKNTAIFILDEPTSAMDPLAEERFVRNYKEIISNRTSIFISHRLLNTKICDRILLIDHGRLVECGTHEALMKAKGLYYELFCAQQKSYGLI